MTLPTKPLMLLLAGLPACGKSSRRKEWLAEDPDGRFYVNYDELRLAMYGPGWHWNRREEELMKVRAYNEAEKALKAGLSVCIDNTNLSANKRQVWKQLAHRVGADYIEEEFDTPPQVCAYRDRRRGDGRVGQAVIDRFALFYGYIDWSECDCGLVTSEAIRQHGHKKRCKRGASIAIVDVDGTLADCSARLQHLTRRCKECGDSKNFVCHKDTGKVLNCVCGGEMSRKNWRAFYEGIRDDKPIVKVIKLVEALSRDHIIVILSGRPIANGATPVGIWTEDWLLQNDVPFDYLFLRQTGDSRKDYEHKGEILSYLPQERVAYVLEDRTQCVEMYRRELPNAIVMQVAEGSY